MNSLDWVQYQNYNAEISQQHKITKVYLVKLTPLSDITHSNLSGPINIPKIFRLCVGTSAPFGKSAAELPGAFIIQTMTNYISNLLIDLFPERRN
jgi:hypothetical protein